MHYVWTVSGIDLKNNGTSIFCHVEAFAIIRAIQLASEKMGGYVKILSCTTDGRLYNSKQELQNHILGKKGELNK